MAGPYELGSVVRLRLTATDTDTSTAVNPTSVALTIKLPDGTTASPSPTNPATGSYRADYTPTLEGIHHYRWVGTGSNAGAKESHFTVKKSQVV